MDENACVCPSTASKKFACVIQRLSFNMSTSKKYSFIQISVTYDSMIFCDLCKSRQYKHFTMIDKIKLYYRRDEFTLKQANI